MKIDIRKNIDFYNSDDSEPCQCDYCKNFYDKVEKAYPEIKEYLEQLGVDIKKPFELCSFPSDDNKTILYVGCQYIVFGECEKDFNKKIGNIEFTNNINHHPSTTITDEHFILDFGTIILSSY